MHGGTNSEESNFIFDFNRLQLEAHTEENLDPDHGLHYRALIELDLT